MPAVNVLIKPASSACNMRCKYCFYEDVAQNRETGFTGLMTEGTLEKVIVSALDYAEGFCTFSFQGGEPTLSGLAFYETVVALQKKHQKPGVHIQNTIQTNGYCIDESWARFFGEHHFLVGLSMDGPAELHDLNRRDAHGGGTWNHAMRAAKLFDRYLVDYNILCVVTGRGARKIDSIYRFFRKQGYHWLQFIPCLEPFGEERGQEAYGLSTEEYGEFLIRIFDLWYQDLQKGELVSIRHLDNWLSVLLGQRAEACSMTGVCSVQFVIEGDGGVYPCDFYVLDEWRLGTVGEQTFAQMEESEVARRFIAGSLHVPEGCRSCELRSICRNGCRRERTVLPDGTIDQNYFCAAYQRFFSQRGEELRQAAKAILRLHAKRAKE